MTLTAEQEKIVNSKDDLIIVKGVAGSGKSLVALHRANKTIKEIHNMPLAFNDSKLESKQKNKTLFITFTNALVGDLKEKFKDYFKKSDLDKIDFMTVDKFLWKICNQIKDNKPNYNVGNYLKFHNYKELIENELKKNNYNFGINFIIDELDYIRSNYLNSYSDYANFTRVGKKRK